MKEMFVSTCKTKTTVTVPLMNGYVYTFGRDVNINWRHGIPQIHPSKKVIKVEYLLLFGVG